MLSPLMKLLMLRVRHTTNKQIAKEQQGESAHGASFMTYMMVVIMVVIFIASCAG